MDLLFDLWVYNYVYWQFMPYMIIGKMSQNDMNMCAKKKGA